MAEALYNSSDNANKINFSEYEKMPEDTNCWVGKKLKSIKKWVVLEKIHGANFSFYITKSSPDQVSIAKRDALLAGSTNFFGINYCDLIPQVSENLKQIYKLLTATNSKDIEQLILYGELFGGYYPCVGVTPSSLPIQPIQYEVKYSPDLRFIAYDIAVCRPGGVKDYLDFDLFAKMCEEAQILYTKAIMIGSLEAALAVDLNFDSLIPKQLGLPALPKGSNTAEGIVIKPSKTIYLEGKKGINSRVILKKKNDKFSERKHTVMEKQAATKYNANDENILLIKFECLALVNKNRVQSAVSKLGLPQNEDDMKKLLQMVREDVASEVKEENTESWGQLSLTVINSLYEELNAEIITVVNDDFNSFIKLTSVEY